MREIKFRAWVKDKKMVYNVVPFQWDYCINRMWHRCIESNGGGLLGSGGTEAKFEVGGYSIVDGGLMQYTGLKDKNGKEIYEGDICTVFTIRPTPIIFHNGAFGYFSADYIMPNFISFAGNSNFAWMDGKSDDIEIIGNIYEHPHLLK